jgi:branched-chain amino acid transport system substrate-binding protein
VGHVTSGASLATAQLYNDARVVQLSPSATSRLFAQAGPFSFRLAQPDDEQGRYLAQVVARDFPRGARIALLYANDDDGRGLRADLRAELDTTRHRVVLELPHAEEDSSAELIRQAARAVGSARPQLILFLGSAPTLVHHIDALRGAAPDVPILGSDAVSSWRRIRPALRAWAGVRYVDLVDLDGSASGRAFAARFAERTGLRATGPDALTYDATRLLLEAVADGARSGEAVRAWLVSLGGARPPFPGVTGPIRFGPARHPERDFVLHTIPADLP